MIDVVSNHEKNAIATEIELRGVRVKPAYLRCPWCDHKHQTVLDRRTEARGTMLCDNCGEFFRWRSHDGEGTTWRVKAKPKGGIDGRRTERPRSGAERRLAGLSPRG